MAGTKRSSRVTRRSTENRQSRTISVRSRSRRSLSANEQASTGRKRKNESEDAGSKKITKENSIPNFQRKIGENGKRYDAFCWVCHKVADEFYCEDCFRVYHDSCRNKIKKHSKSCACECKLTSVDGLQTSSCKSSDLKVLFLHALHKVIEENKSQKKNEDKNPGYMKMLATWPDLPENDFLYDTIDIELIIDNINLAYYKSTGEFYQAVKLLYHNCYIIHGSDSEITLKAQKFEKAIKQQLADIEACADCYREKSAKYPEIEFFTKVCSRQHQIVWAKLKGFPFWPAKCLRIVNGHADVRFFGTHDKSLVPLAQVYKISKKNPGCNPKKPKCSTRMSTYEEAMAELSLYVRNYITKFGSFTYSDEKTPLEIGNSMPEKKMQQAKSSSQQDDSMNTEVNDSIEFSATQNSPQLNVSCLNEVETKVKVPVLRLEKYFDKSNEDLAENVVLMTFSTAEEDPPAEIIPSTSESHSQLPEISSQIPETTINNNSSEVCDSNVPSTNVLLNAENVQYNSEDHINTNACTDSTLPVLITSTHSLNQSFDQPTDLTNEAPRTSGNESEFAGNATNDDDDDIQLLIESNGARNTEKTIGDYILKNKSLTKTLCELLLANKPNIRNAVAQYQNTSLQFFLMMWLEANQSRFSVNECKTFNVFYEKLCKKLEVANTQVRRLQKENAELKEKLAIKITEEERKTALQREISQAFCKSKIDSKNQTVMELKKKTHQLEEAKKTIGHHKAKEEMFASQIENKNKEIEELKKTIEALKSKEISFQNDVKSVECQTQPDVFSPTRNKHFKDKLLARNSLDQLNMDINASMDPTITQQHGTLLSGETIQSSTLTVSECSGIIEYPAMTSMLPPNLCQPLMPQPTLIQFPGIPPTAVIQNSSSHFIETKRHSKSFESHSSRAVAGHSSKVKHVSKYTSNKNYSKTYSGMIKKITKTTTTKKHK